MKTKLFFLLTFLTANLGWGQTLIDNSASGASIPATWSSTNGITANTIQQTAGGGYYLVESSAMPVYDYLFSNTYATINGASSVEISFDIATFGAGTDSPLKVDMSIDNGATYISTQTSLATPTSSTFVNTKVTFTGTISSTQVKFRFYDGINGNKGVRVKNIVITAFINGLPQEINVKGNSVSIVDGDTTPATADHTDFGTIATSTNMARVFTIENTGGADLNISSIAMASGTDFVISGAPSTIAAGSSANFTVTFNSATASTFTNTINIVNNDADEANYNFDLKVITQTPTPSIKLKGNSVLIAPADVTPSLSDHTDFGSTTVATNFARTYTLENTGTGSLIVNNILMLNTTTKYTISGIALPTNIAPNGSTTFIVTFNSAAAGTFADNVLVESNDPTNSTYNFAVTASARTLNFNVGDISILGLSADTPDSFNFVNWVTIPVDAELYFTDSSFDGTALKTNEGIVKWTNNTGAAIAAGTVINVFTSPVSTDLGAVTNTNSFDITAGAETILLYEGSVTNPSFIHGVSKGAWITTGVVANSNSYLPSSLNVTNGNVVLGTSDNYEYNNSRDNQEFLSDYKAMVNNPLNYKSSSSYFALSSEDLSLAVVWSALTWSNTTGPTSSLSAVLKDAYNTTTNGAMIVKDLTIKTGGSVVVEATNPITIHGNLLNNLTETAFVVNNGGSVLQPNNTTTNKNVGSITYKRATASLAHDFDVVYLGSPLENPTLASAWMTTANDTFYSFNTALAGGQNWETAAPTATMDPAKGFIARAVLGSPGWTTLGTSYTMSFVGKPNNGNYNFTIVKDGTANVHNLLANPYPSALDLIAFSTDTDNSSKLTGNYYFWINNTAVAANNTYANNDYATYNVNINAGTGVGSPAATGGTTPTQYVAAGQAFFTEAAAAGPVTFKNTHRVAGNNNTFYRTSAQPASLYSDKVWLNLSNNQAAFKQQIIAYTQQATTAFDTNFDAKTFDGNPSIDFYSIIPSAKFTIQSRPVFNANDVVALGFRTTTAGTFQINIDHADGVFANGQRVYLQDNLLGLDFDITTAAYSFTTQAGTFDNRFVLKYTSALSTNATVYDNSILVTANKNVLKISSSMEDMAAVSIFDLLGRQVYTKAINAKDFIASNLATNQQVLVVKITLTNGVVVTKKIIL